MRAAQAGMRPPPVKRFYRRWGQRGGRVFALTLDGRKRAHAGTRPLATKSRAIVEKTAEEWARQGETLDPPTCRSRGSLNSALDGVAKAMDETRAEIVALRRLRLLCYRAEEPEALAERQRRASIRCSTGRPKSSARVSSSQPASCMSSNPRRRSRLSAPRSGCSTIPSRSRRSA